MNTKITLFTIVTALFLSFTSCKNEAQTNTATNKDLASVSKIEVLDFHSTHRCMTCNAIEANTKYTLETYFSKELASDKITFQVINVDKEENEKIAEKFEASGTALILNVIKNGKEEQIDLTDFAFMNGNDQDAFSKELKTKLEAQLKSL